MLESRRTFIFPGVIRGQGQSARCRVWATAIARPEHPDTFIGFEIHDVSRRLQEGDYELQANGKTLTAFFKDEKWIVLL
jgi:hypothetical protein